MGIGDDADDQFGRHGRSLRRRAAEVGCPTQIVHDYQRNSRNSCGTNFEPPRSASVKPKTKNWLGFGIRFPVASGNCLKEIVVVGHPEGVNRFLAAPDVRTERNALHFGRNVPGGNAVRGQHLNDIEEQSLGDWWVAAVKPSIALTSTAPSRSILKSCFTFALLAIGAAIAVTLVDQELVIIDGADFADARAGSERIGVLVSHVAGSDVDGDDAQQSWRRRLSRLRPGSAHSA